MEALHSFTKSAETCYNCVVENQKTITVVRPAVKPSKFCLVMLISAFTHDVLKGRHQKNINYLLTYSMEQKSS
jgi:hypothetical protein